MADDTVTIRDKGLKALIKAFRNPPSVKVGILGGGGRTNGQSNAQIGMRHEFGTGVPQRSFIRVPLMENFQQFLKSSQAFTPETLKKIIDEKSLNEWLVKIGLCAEQTIAEAFASGGFGKWPALKAGYQNNTGQILVDTQQLRNSISSELIEGKK